MHAILEMSKGIHMHVALEMPKGIHRHVSLDMSKGIHRHVAFEMSKGIHTHVACAKCSQNYIMPIDRAGNHCKFTLKDSLDSKDDFLFNC